MKGLSPKKAKMMLHDDSAQGHPLTSKQRGLFGLIASGKQPTKMKAKRKRRNVVVPSYKLFRD